MPRLKDRNSQVPNGLSFRQPETGWWSRDVLGSHPSFDTLVRAVQTHRMGNPVLLQKGLRTDYDGVAAEVENYNALICQERGWTKYILGGSSAAAPAPKVVSLPRRLRDVAAGADTLVSWIRSGADAVPSAQSESRASVCTRCPKNRDRKLTDIFNVAVSEAIRAAYNQREKWNLKTSLDDKLGICDVCFCPLKLKVHMPIKSIMDKLPQSTYQELPEACWIRSENHSGQ